MSSTHESAYPVHHVGHHFNNASDEFEAAKQGMWVFLVTEILMFGGLFVAYGIFRGMYPEMYVEAHHALQMKMGALNTIVLITSSLTMALAVSATQRGKKQRAIGMMAATIFLACCFLVVKYFEYSHKFHEGLLPGAFYSNTEITNPKAPLFFSLYFMMTGLHGIHVLIGIGLISWMILRSLRNEFSENFYTPVELVGFYWHFVDIVWIYLFPLLYLVS
ncbi:MAG: cytochrome c oxidase subunit 3 family protein [Oligoflexia bacterium]|nr:cytochrome c oxidase subunit 3 family protein [Oligoflexia bacterium]